MKGKSGTGLRIGLVGAGRWGSNYLHALPATDGARLVAVCDPDPAARSRASSFHPGLRLATDIEEILPSVDAVVIAAPSSTHAHLSLRALDAGKHVLVEKPLATDVTAACAVVDQAISAKRTLLVGQLTLLHPALATARDLVESGVIGTLRSIEAQRTSSGARHRRDSALWSLGPHDIANVLFVTKTTEARVGKVWEGADDAWLELELEGASARMTWSRAAAAPERRLVIEGSQGSLELDETTGRLQLERGGKVTVVANGAPTPSLLERLCHQFVSSVLTSGQTKIGEALQVVRILATAQLRLDGTSPDQTLSAAV